MERFLGRRRHWFDGGCNRSGRGRRLIAALRITLPSPFAADRQATDSYARSRVNCVPKRRGRKRNTDFADAGRRFVVWQYVSFKRAWQRRDPQYKRTLAIREKASVAHHHYVGNSLHNLALLYFKQGLYTQAEPLYERSLSIWYRTLGPDHPYVATCLEDLAALYRATNRVEEAETLEQRAVRIRALQR